MVGQTIEGTALPRIVLQSDTAVQRNSRWQC